MIKYTIDLDGDINKFTTNFIHYMEDIFNNISITIDNTDQTRINVIDSNTDDILFYFYVARTIYNNRDTLLLKTYGNTVNATTYNREDSSDWGPQVLYKNENDVICSRAGFVTSGAQKFIIDSITVCLDDNSKANYYIAFSCKEYIQPLFIISPTNLGNLGIIGITTNNSNTTGMRTLTYNNKKTIEHNLNNIQISNSSVTSLTKLFIPESLNGEYFNYVYMLLALEDIEDEYLKFNNHIYMRCLKDKLAVIIY